MSFHDLFDLAHFIYLFLHSLLITGDVDSGEEGADIYSQLRPYPLPLPSVHHVHLPSTSLASRNKNTGSGRKKKLHETKL